MDEVQKKKIISVCYTPSKPYGIEKKLFGHHNVWKI